MRLHLRVSRVMNEDTTAGPSHFLTASVIDSPPEESNFGAFFSSSIV